MNLQAYLSALWRRKWAILVVAALSSSVANIGTLLITPTYRASATLRVGTATTGSPEQLRYDITYADRLMNTYARMVTSGPVLENVQQQLNLATPPQVEVTILPNTELMQISVEHTDPTVAASTANTLAEVLVAQVLEQNANGRTAQEILSQQLAQVERELQEARTAFDTLATNSPQDSERVIAARRALEFKEQTYGTLVDQYARTRIIEGMRANTATVVDGAVAPRVPFSPSYLLNTLIGMVIGLVAGIGLAFMFENLDTTLYTTRHVAETTRLPILGQVPRGKRRRASPIFNSNSAQEEAFRHLRTNLFPFEQGHTSNTLLVTSAQPGEGKSTILANLAVAIAKSGRKVIAVDSNLRRSTLHHAFDLPNGVGLSNVLKGEATLSEAIQDTNIPGLQVLTSGPLPSNPAELLGSSQMAELLRQLDQRNYTVLLDTPALLPVADAAVLASLVDGVILVVGLAQVGREAVQTASQHLDNVKARSISLVVNRTERDRNYSYQQAVN